MTGGARRRGVGEVSRDDSLKTEEKTVAGSDIAREEGPNPCDPRGLWLTAHQCTN